MPVFFAFWVASPLHVIELLDLKKTYTPKGSASVRALDGVSLRIEKGELGELSKVREELEEALDRCLTV